MKLTGEVALVTGGTKGIGEGIVGQFAWEGARVAFTGRDAAAGARVERRISTVGGSVTFLACDAGNPDEVRAAVDATVATYGKLTILVNNVTPSDMLRDHAGDAPVTDIDPDAYRRILAVGFDSMTWACSRAIPHMVEAGHGAIVNISSAVAVQGTHGLFAYTAAKGAMNAVTRQIAVDFGRAGIRCNGIVVGPVEKPGAEQNPSVYDDPDVRAAFMRLVCTPRLGLPRDIARAAVFLASEDAEFVTGSLLTVDGGMTARQFHPDVTDVRALRPSPSR
jgi:NAD(P)-dependent dehydrogenase (short-subunit alcohol dehydrogenase family)